MIDVVKSGGFNMVRIPVTWQSHLGPAPDYTIDKAWLDRVEEIANYVLKDGMYAMVNTHHDGWYKLATASQAAGVDEVTKVWTQIAARFKDYDDHLVLETFNEPHGTVNAYGGGNAEQQGVLNAYNLAAVNAIRATGGNNALRHLVIPTHGASPPTPAIQALVIPNDDARVIVSLHTYYGGVAGFGGKAFAGTADDYTAMATELDRIAGLLTKKGRAVIIGEWGSVSTFSTSVREVHAKAYAQDVTARGMLPVWWDNGGRDFGLLNRKVTPPVWTYPTIVAALKEGATLGSTTGADAGP
jgi:aryl-phospho-beta-D-glucosidase BglC (GH1 family)